MSSEASPRQVSAAVRRFTAEHVVARALLEAASFAEAAPQILSAVCSSLGWEHGALFRLDPESGLMRCADIWPSPSPFPSFEAISREMEFREGVGLPGRVWATGKPAWIPDVVADVNFPRAAAASKEGLHAAFGFPVLLRGEVVGVMEFFSREVREPDEELLALLSTVGSQIGMFIDRRRAEEERDRFFTLSLDMLCIASFDGYFKRVNPAWTRVLGYTEEELLSRPYVELVHPDDRDATRAEAGRLADGQQVLYFENRYFHKDGSLKWLLWAAAPFTAQKLIYGAARDITERKLAEERMARDARDLKATHRALEDQASRLEQLVRELEIAKRRAEEATEMKGAFLANMSHEIRTPLNAIIGMTTLALKTRLSAEQQDYLSTVKTSADSLLGIINDILDFSKIEARRMDLEYVEFDLRETVGDSAKLLALRAEEKGIELACDVSTEVPERLLGDPGRLRQVLLNVLGNAVKFTVRGEVVLRVSVDEARQHRTTLRFSVSDTGIGIPADKRQQIFQAFTQADSSTTRRFGGTGLGLAIAQRLVELMEGRIWLDSEVGRGSTFHFTATFGRAAPSTRVVAADRPAALTGLRVLVVDDNSTNRRIMQDMLASWQMKPVTVGDAGTAITELQSAWSTDDRFHVVISDCQMPDVDGFMLARRIRQDDHLKATPIVMLTSVGRSDDVTRCHRLGVDAYLTKPVKHSDLLDALATLFGVSARTPRPRSRRPTRDVAARPLRVLVAEDNPVNRKLVTTLLNKRGHHVRAVDDGRAAVRAVTAEQDERFDVALMDVQMPEMSGFEATHEIRLHEAGTGHHLPIIALTAHAMQGDKDRCLAAGMDAYLAKPIDVDELVATVEHFASPLPTVPASPTTGTGPAPAFDENVALAYAGGDRRLLRQVIKLFRADAPGTLRSIGAAIEEQDAEALRQSAHALRGAMAAIGATAGHQIATRLEELGRSAKLDEAPELYAALKTRVGELHAAVEAAGLAAPAAAAARNGSPSSRKPATRRRKRS